MYDHILISTDGSEVGQKGVDHGLSLAKALGSKVSIITVTERFPLYAGGVGLDFAANDTTMADFAEAQEESAKAILAASRQSAERLGVKAELLHASVAQPAEAIVEAAVEHRCSLIVMASHGRRGIGRLVLGSKTAEVLAHSPVPVLVVR